MQFEVGQRICSSEEPHVRGSVRYVGPVAGQKGVWYGIEWEDTARGKHSGEAGGQKYFECQDAGSGSFVRAHKISCGVTIVAALKARYQPGKREEKEEGMYILSLRNRVVPIELVGKQQILEHQSDLHQLRSACLADSAVSSAGPPGEVSSVAPNLRALNLSGHLLPDWQAVAGIARELPALAVLDLSNSRLTLGAPWRLPRAFESLQTLVLNRTAIQWAQVAAIERCCPRLEELHLCHNGIRGLQLPAGDAASELPDPADRWQHLRLLDLEDNGIAEWSEVAGLAHLPR
eukprot:jgi/Mesen1/718/ME001096S10747